MFTNNSNSSNSPMSPNSVVNVREPRVIYVSHGDTPIFNRYDAHVDTPVQVAQEYVYNTPEKTTPVLKRVIKQFEVKDDVVVPRDLNEEFKQIVVKRKYTDETSTLLDDGNETDVDDDVTVSNETEVDDQDRYNTELDEYDDVESISSDDSHVSHVIDMRPIMVYAPRKQKRTGIEREQWLRRLRIREAQQEIQDQLDREYRREMRAQREEEKREHEEFLRSNMGQENLRLVQHFMKNQDLLFF